MVAGDSRPGMQAGEASASPQGLTPVHARPLAGVTVLTLEHAVAAPFATRQLADLGARATRAWRAAPWPPPSMPRSPWCCESPAPRPRGLPTMRGSPRTRVSLP
jgi:hypothetical protein